METLRDRIFAADDVTAEVVDCPEWGCKIEVRAMTGVERANLLGKYAEAGGVQIESLYPALVCRCAYDPDTGERIFQDDDEGRLNTKNGAVLERVGKVALALNGMSSEGEGDLGKGSLGTPSDASTSTSQDT